MVPLSGTFSGGNRGDSTQTRYSLLTLGASCAARRIHQTLKITPAITPNRLHTPIFDPLLLWSRRSQQVKIGAPLPKSGESPARMAVQMAFLRRHLSAVAGWVVVAYGLIDPILGAAEHAEFITRNLEAWKRIVTLALSPPLWASPLIVVVGLLLIWWDKRRRLRADRGQWFHTNHQIFDEASGLVDLDLLRKARQAVGDNRSLAWQKVVDDLHQRLKKGINIAKASDMLIPAEHWAEVRFKSDSDFTEARGSGVVYTDIRIARA